MKYTLPLDTWIAPMYDVNGKKLDYNPSQFTMQAPSFYTKRVALKALSRPGMLN